MKAIRIPHPSLRLAIAPAILGLLLLMSAGGGPEKPAQTVVPVGDLWFCSGAYQGGVCTTTITAGDTVSWDFSGASIFHTTTECGASCDSPTAQPLWDSGLVLDGGTYEHTFSQPGTFLYYCSEHPSLMRGKIVVQQTACPWDIDADGAVSSGDIASVVGHFGHVASQDPAKWVAHGDSRRDLNGDGAITLGDVALVVWHFGQVCS